MKNNIVENHSDGKRPRSILSCTRKKIALFLTVLCLLASSACSAVTNQNIPEATEEITAIVATATLTPLPTITPTVTATPEVIKLGEVYRLVEGGSSKIGPLQVTGVLTAKQVSDLEAAVRIAYGSATIYSKEGSIVLFEQNGKTFVISLADLPKSIVLGEVTYNLDTSRGNVGYAYYTNEQGETYYMTTSLLFAKTDFLLGGAALVKPEGSDNLKWVLIDGDGKPVIEDSLVKLEKLLGPKPRPIDEAKEKANREAVAARVDDYLNERGDFTQDMVRKNMFTMNYIPDKNYPQMGILDAGGFLTDGGPLTEVDVAGLDLGWVNAGGVRVFIIGTQDVNGKRFVVPVQYLWKDVSTDDVNTGAFLYSTNDIAHFYGTQFIVRSDARLDEILTANLGKAIGVNLVIVPFKDSFMGGNTLIVHELDWDKITQMEDSHVPANINLVYSVWRDMYSNRYPAIVQLSKEIKANGGNQTPKVTIKSLADLENLANMIDQLPYMIGFGAVIPQELIGK